MIMEEESLQEERPATRRGFRRYPLLVWTLVGVATVVHFETHNKTVMCNVHADINGPPFLSTPKQASPSLVNLQTEEMNTAMYQSCPPPDRLATDPNMTLPIFVNNVIDLLQKHTLKRRPLFYMLKHANKIWKTRGGLEEGFYAELGVWRGSTLTTAHQVLENSIFRGPMVGFDSFEGLPVDWRSTFTEGVFNNTSYAAVRARLPPDVELYPGWFQDTIGSFLLDHPAVAASLIHHDADLFVSTAISLSLLAHRIVPGTFMCFDELLGYPGFQHHEILALFLWMNEYQATLCPIGIKKKLTDLERKGVGQEACPACQSACFQVLDLVPRY